MDPNSELARRRLALAEETLREAKALASGGHLRGTLNRAYYAAFYAARALLATKELDSAKHSGVLSLFGQHFVRTGVVGGEHGRALNAMFRLRLRSDYQDFIDLKPEEVRQHLDDAEAFVAAVREALSSLLGDQEDAQPSGDS